MVAGKQVPTGNLPSADSILQQEYGGATNFMTPDVLEVGKVGPLEGERIIVYEIAEGTSMEQQPIFGVTIVTYDTSTGETARRIEESDLFNSIEEAGNHLRQFGEVYPETHVEVRERPEWKEKEHQGWSNWYTWNLALWASNEEPTYRMIQENRPFTPRSAEALGNEMFPGGTGDMDGPYDMDYVNWAEVAEAWNQEE